MVERAVLKEYTQFIEGVRIPGTLEGVTRVYECQANTVAEGMTSTVCQIDGRWSTTNLYCRRKFCIFLPCSLVECCIDSYVN